ncbi:MAG: hypothetical protein HQL42_12985 [Alphaproteobacteria bacterium]|nr:hypothetical protein [Alphaproteobacteria bacterium]
MTYEKTEHEKMIERADTANERMEGYAARWMANPEFRAALLRHLPQSPLPTDTTDTDKTKPNQ